MSASGNVSVKQMAIHLSEIIIIIFTLFFVVSVYSSTERISDVSCDDAAKAVLGEDMRAPDRSVAGTKLEFERTFGVTASDYDGIIYFKPESGMDVTEIIIAKSSSQEARDKLVKAIDDHLSQRRDVFQGYAPDQYALLMKAKAVESEGFVFCAVGDDTDKMYDLFYKAVRD